MLLFFGIWAVVTGLACLFTFPAEVQNAFAAAGLIGLAAAVLATLVRLRGDEAAPASTAGEPSRR